MSAIGSDARVLLVAAVVARLKALAGLAGVAVFDAPPVRGGLPHAVVEEPVLADASAAGCSGREARLTVMLEDAGERPVRLRALLAAVEAGLPGLAGTAIGGGWRLVTIRLTRSRLARAGRSEGRWQGSVEFAARMWRQD
ncbi:DUF3168 domain-containing protein [Sphingomonas abaci]|uniref:DUF3168 domain-containing protein n=1 Tax=Sphingomonas abaci TaxID=237611 RepID=A0A7W7ALP8_9SPHN|nr:hypothetical protein [Sphingomonas abaci]